MLGMPAQQEENDWHNLTLKEKINFWRKNWELHKVLLAMESGLEQAEIHKTLANGSILMVQS